MLPAAHATSVPALTQLPRMDTTGSPSVPVARPATRALSSTGGKTQGSLTQLPSPLSGSSTVTM